MDPDDGRIRSAIFAPGVATCGRDRYLLLTYALRMESGAWLHALALPADGAAPVWIVPNPNQQEPAALDPAQRASEAWPPVDLSLNYPPGAYRLLWAMCDEPIPWRAWADAADAGQAGIEGLLDGQQGCNVGSWLLVVREMTP